MYEQGRKELVDIHTELDEIKSKVCIVSEKEVYQYECNCNIEGIKKFYTSSNFSVVLFYTLN